MISRLFDEHVRSQIRVGLAQRRHELDILRFQDVGLTNTPDAVILEPRGCSSRSTIRILWTQCSFSPTTRAMNWRATTITSSRTA